MPLSARRWRPTIIFAFMLLACLFEDDYEPRYLQDNHEFPVPSGDVDVADWSSALAKARCSFLERCNHYDLQGRVFRNEPCLDYFRAFYEDVLDVAALVDEGRITWNDAEFGRCVRDMARASCEEYWRPRACYEGHGTQSDGAECGSDAECGPDLFCEYDEQCGGRCRPTLPRGKRCQHRFQCQKGLDCDDRVQSREGTWGTCRPFAKRGMECDVVESLCGPSMTCKIRDGYDQTGDCKPRKAGWNAPGQTELGAICYASTVCLNDTECRPVELYGEPAYAVTRCTDAIALGATCLRADKAPLSACASGGYCAADEDLEDGECVPRIEQDLPCTGAHPHECLEGLVCDPASLTCQARRYARHGEACKTLLDCYSGECSDGRCSTVACPWGHAP